MSQDQLSRRCRRLLERLSQPSSATALAALRALLVPQLSRLGPSSSMHQPRHQNFECPF
jgi:hypothetical protein